ncbi:hypothetical protein [Spirosoma fluviale]|uniref:Uncharacterized protein n=1 Tax=Spirosoma fluviale TaxID=1597977 RepID=A0A286FBX1_9BACT|nr:hypothetical protein [Spirosoma fluviale]SOD80683.1 hypothetical protein SAMN06269250_1524 [Spirosoma fluviale]
MSLKNFYQTVYQTDTLFRVPGESWSAILPSAPSDGTAEELIAVDTENLDLLAELDALSIGKFEVAADRLPTDRVSDVSAPLAPEPPLVVATPTPEPLPKEVPRPTTPSVIPPVQQQSRMPQLNHKVLLLADEALDPSNILFLERILKAVNLNIDGVDLLNLHGVEGMNFAELLRGKYINHFITFGVPFERIDLDIMMDRYSPVRFEGITFLMADSLPTIEADQNLKKQLWSALKRVFQL